MWPFCRGGGRPEVGGEELHSALSGGLSSLSSYGEAGGFGGGGEEDLLGASQGGFRGGLGGSGSGLGLSVSRGRGWGGGAGGPSKPAHLYTSFE